MDIERIKEIQEESGYSESINVQQALIQVWQETENVQSPIQNDTLTLRDNFAIAAMNGELAGGKYVWVNEEKLAENAYAVADAMLKVRMYEPNIETNNKPKG